MLQDDQPTPRGTLSNWLPILGLSVSMALFAEAKSANGEPNMEGPRLRTHLEIFDFGTVPQHSQVAHAFWLINEGTETAVITKVKTNCGCTSAPLADTVIAAGDSTWMEVTLGTGKMLGDVEKHTRVVKSNARGRVPVFTIQAHVVSDTTAPGSVAADPMAVYIDSINVPELVDGSWDMSFALRNLTDERVTVSAIDVPAKFVQLDSYEFTIDSGGQVPVRLRIDPSVMDEPFCKSVTFEASDPERTRLSIPFGKQPEY